MNASEQAPEVADELGRLLARRDQAAMRKFLAPWLAQDLAPHLAGFTPEQLATLFRCAPREVAAQAFGYLPGKVQRRLLKLMNQEQTAQLLESLPSDDRTRFLADLPLDVAMQLLTLLSPAERRIAQDLLAYPEHSVGRMMTLDFVTIPPECTVAEALARIRSEGFDRETLNIIYVIDSQGRLLDDVRVRRLLLAEPSQSLRELLDGDAPSLAATDDREKALAEFRHYDRVALPVVDDSGRIIGIVTADDMLDVASEAATEDIQKLGGSESLDEPYSTIPLSRMVRKRATWLVVLFLGELLTASAMGYFEDEIAKAVVLALFVPLVISSGGNAGSQAATLVIRAMALGEVGVADWWRVMRRELAAGLMLGLILGVVGFARIALWAQFSDLYGPHWMRVAASVGSSLVGIVLWGSLSGSMLPLLLKRAGLDPATSSAPFVATLVDVTGLVIYFTVAWMFLRDVLL